jgi:probable rRNA maturation factor
MIEIINRQKRYWINKNRFRDLLKRLMNHYQHSHAEVTLAFVDNRIIKGLNKRFLKKNEPTDVLSFPIREKGADDKYYLGDIIISAHQAFKQCLKKNYGLEEELQILTIHGFLHLLGFEHEKGIEEEEQKISQLLIGGSHGN